MGDELKELLSWVTLVVGPPGLVIWHFVQTRRWARELGALRAEFIAHMRALHGASEDATDPRLVFVKAKGL